jgi:hypothetical protein
MGPQGGTRCGAAHVSHGWRPGGAPCEQPNDDSRLGTSTGTTGVPELRANLQLRMSPIAVHEGAGPDQVPFSVGRS